MSNQEEQQHEKNGLAKATTRNPAAPPLPATHLHMTSTSDTDVHVWGQVESLHNLLPRLISFSSAINCALAKMIYFKKSVIFSWPWGENALKAFLQGI